MPCCTKGNPGEPDATWGSFTVAAPTAKFPNDWFGALLISCGGIEDGRLHTAKLHDIHKFTYRKSDQAA